MGVGVRTINHQAHMPSGRIPASLQTIGHALVRTSLVVATSLMTSAILLLAQPTLASAATLPQPAVHPQIECCGGGGGYSNAYVRFGLVGGIDVINAAITSNAWVGKQSSPATVTLTLDLIDPHGTLYEVNLSPCRDLIDTSNSCNRTYTGLPEEAAGTWTLRAFGSSEMNGVGVQGSNTAETTVDVILFSVSDARSSRDLRMHVS